MIVAEFEQELRRRSKSLYGRWHAVDLHNHSPADHDFQGDRNSALDEAADHLRQTQVDIVMFTDHEKLPDRHLPQLSVKPLRVAPAEPGLYLWELLTFTHATRCNSLKFE